MASKPEDRSLSTLLVDLQRDASKLVRQELDLLRAEINEKIRKLFKGLGALIASVIVCFVALIIVLMGLAELINEFLPAELALWLGYVIVGGIVLAIGIFALVRGLKNLEAAIELPQRSAASLHEDVEMMRRRTGGSSSA